MYDFGSIGIYYSNVWKAHYDCTNYSIILYSKYVIFYLIIRHVQSIVVKFHRLNKRNNTAMFNNQL